MSDIARLNRKRPLAESVELNGENLSDWNPNCPGARAKRHEAKTPQDLLEREAKAAAILFSLDSTTCGNLLIPRGKGVLIGRSRKCDIVVEPPDCSSKHCQIGSSDVGGRQAVFVKDMSTNGTFVNGTLVGKGNTCLLRDGDRISFAASCEFITKYNKKAARAGKSFFDKYILSSKVLGTGHYAQVKEAVCRETGKVCAVKIFNPRKHTLGAASKIQTNEAADEVNLDRELDILTKLDHRNVVGFYGTYLEPVSRDSVTTYLVLEEVNGGELFKRIVSKGKLRQDETQNIMCQLLTGLRYLHSMGVVHRDLKPENILLEVISGPQAAPWDAGERSVRVKIADFGLAKFIGNFSFTNTLCGTRLMLRRKCLLISKIGATIAQSICGLLVCFYTFACADFRLSVKSLGRHPCGSRLSRRGMRFSHLTGMILRTMLLILFHGCLSRTRTGAYRWSRRCATLGCATAQSRWSWRTRRRRCGCRRQRRRRQQHQRQRRCATRCSTCAQNSSQSASPHPPEDIPADQSH